MRVTHLMGIMELERLAKLLADYGLGFLFCGFALWWAVKNLARERALNEKLHDKVLQLALSVQRTTDTVARTLEALESSGVRDRQALLDVLEDATASTVKGLGDLRATIQQLDERLKP